jgi:hypothetical protein
MIPKRHLNTIVKYFFIPSFLVSCAFQSFLVPFFSTSNIIFLSLKL